MRQNALVSRRPKISRDVINLDPHQFLNMVGGQPDTSFQWKTIGKGKYAKRRLIGRPNNPMRKLHKLFEEYLEAGIKAVEQDCKEISTMPSATGCVKESNPLKNAKKHIKGKFLYITDIKNAYPSIDLERLAMLIVYMKKYDEYKDYFSLRLLGTGEAVIEILCDDQLYQPMLSFLQVYCAGLYGKGLAVGAPLSPRFMNLYCEVYLDESLRRLCRKHDATYTRFVDDIVISRKSADPLDSVSTYINRALPEQFRKDVRSYISRAGLSVNHQKSKVLSRRIGTVFVTKIGLRVNPEDEDGEAILVFPQKKRRKLHGAITSYIREVEDRPEEVSGLVAEFLYYFKTVKVKTKTDLKTFQLCKEFEAEWAKWDHNKRPWLRIIKR